MFLHEPHQPRVCLVFIGIKLGRKSQRAHNRIDRRLMAAILAKAPARLPMRFLYSLRGQINNRDRTAGKKQPRLLIRRIHKPSPCASCQPSRGAQRDFVWTVNKLPDTWLSQGIGHLGWASASETLPKLNKT